MWLSQCHSAHQWWSQTFNLGVSEFSLLSFNQGTKLDLLFQENDLCSRSESCPLVSKTHSNDVDKNNFQPSHVVKHWKVTKSKSTMPEKRARILKKKKKTQKVKNISLWPMNTAPGGSAQHCTKRAKMIKIQDVSYVSIPPSYVVHICQLFLSEI